MQLDELSTQTWLQTNPGGNFTNNGYPTRIASVTPPNLAAVSTGLQAVGDGVIPMGHGGGIASRGVVLIPYGAGSSTNTFSMQVLGWRATGLGVGQNTALWIPVTLGTYAITLGTGTGIANADLTTTALFATTITMTGGPTFVTSGAAPVVPEWFQLSPGSNAIGAIFIRSLGFRFLETIYTTGGVATSCNALYAKF